MSQKEEAPGSLSPIELEERLQTLGAEGAELEKAGQFNDASEKYLSVLKLFKKHRDRLPQYPAAQINIFLAKIGNCKQKLGQFEDAARFFQYHLDSIPEQLKTGNRDYSYYFLRICECQNEVGRYAETL